MGTQIIDATLREGNQAPGVRFSVAQSEQIAAHLATIGVDCIECGHPAASQLERDRLKAVCKLNLGIPSLGHARAQINDIKAVAECGAEWVGIFLGVNSISRQTRVRRSEGELIELIESAIRAAREMGLSVRYTLEDASRTPDELMTKAYATAVSAGATRLCVADTVGVLEPREVSQRVARVCEAYPDTTIEVHLHNDRGLALANALAAIDAGALWVSTSVNGLGERCGITDLAVLLANLHFRGDRLISNPGAIHELTQRVAEISKAPVEPWRPIVGASAFRHTAVLHVKAVQRDPTSYSWIDPPSLGRRAEPGNS